MQDWIKAYGMALETRASGYTQKPFISSVFFGGGTPTLMPPALVASIVEKIAALFPVAGDIEITMEANPTSSEKKAFADFKKAGVNRLSLGVQSLNDADLNFLGRRHTVSEALSALDSAASLFERFSFDLIYARPGQTPKEWEAELRQALQFAKGHLSLYELTIETGTAFEKQQKRGVFKMPDEEQASDMLMQTFSQMREAGIPAYEVSNFASAGQECRYNMQTWSYADYIGIGPGAHGRIHTDTKKLATYDEPVPARWMAAVFNQGHGTKESSELTDQDQFEEAVMAGLRMRRGFSIAELEKVTGKPFAESVNKDRLCALIEQNLITEQKGRILVTEKGLAFTDGLARALLS